MTHPLKIPDHASRGLSAVAELLVVLSKHYRTPLVADFIRFKAIENMKPDRVGCYGLCAATR